MITLRPYQDRAFRAIEALWATNTLRVCAVAPTGSGKGSLSAWMLHHYAMQGKHGLFVVHRSEILFDQYERVRAAGTTSIGVLKAQDRRKDANARVQIASIDTLRARRALPRADVLVIDEAHRACSPGYVKLLDAYPGIPTLLMTATPERLDGKGLDRVAQALVLMAQPGELIEEGYIVDPRVFTVPLDLLPDVTGIQRLAGDFNTHQLAKVANQKKILGGIVRHYQERADGKLAICFAVNVEHSKAIVEEFRCAGIPAEHLDGTMDDDLRAAVLARFRRGETRVVSSCNLLVEGVDVPEAEVAILARPTESITVYLQAVGRIMRPFPGKDALVLDHAGNARRHGLPSVDREWTLSGRVHKAKGSSDDVRTRTCPQCYRVLAAHIKICPSCDTVLTQSRGIETVEGDLVEVESAAPKPKADPKKVAWDRLWREAHEEGYKPLWVHHKFVERFKEEPPKEFEVPPKIARVWTPDEKMKGLERFYAAAHRHAFTKDWIDERYRAKFGEEAPVGTLADIRIAMLKKTQKQTELPGVP